MSGIWWNKGILVSTLIEILGFKTGLLVDIDDLCKHVPEFETLLRNSNNNLLRTETTTFDEIYYKLLHQLGYSEIKYNGIPTLISDENFHKYPKECKEVIALLRHPDSQPKDGSKLFGKEYLDKCKKKSNIHYALGIEALHDLDIHLKHSHFSLDRYNNWHEVIELKSLFNFKKLQSMKEAFFDQQLVNYLSNNFEKIHEIHWRQFEFLIAEFFKKMNFRVEIGKGTNDGGIDIKASPKNEEGLILIQCKKYKEKVKELYVKAFFVDMDDNNAIAGVIASTSYLSPGAKTIIEAHKYSILDFNKDTVKKYLVALRTR
jgi:restriction system protein